MGLDDAFNTIKTPILSTKPTPSLGTAYHLVAEDKQQRAITTTRRPNADAPAFQRRNQKRKWRNAKTEDEKGLDVLIVND